MSVFLKFFLIPKMSLDKIKEQMEFYFSDANFSKDKFMQARAKENDGFIPISVFLTFKRMKNLDADVEKIKEAMADSKMVEIKDDSIRKIETEEYKSYISTEVDDRVLYMKGFDENLNLDEIKLFLKDYFTPVKITMRRDHVKKFKGSCFVELSSAEEAKKVLEMKIPVESIKETEDSKRSKTLQYIEILSKNDYFGSKKNEEKNKKENKKNEDFAEKVKESFIPRLFKYECEISLSIEEVKNIIKETAFADIVKKVIRLKYEDERQNFEVEFEKDGKKHLLKMIKFSEEEAKEYVSKLTIRKNFNKKK